MMAMEVVVNADKYEDKLATTRKICSFLSKKLGMSKNDLCPALKSKFDEVAAIPSLEVSWSCFVSLFVNLGWFRMVMLRAGLLAHHIVAKCLGQGLEN